MSDRDFHATEIVRIKFGSHLYGTETPSSDTDYKSVAIPGGKDILLQRAFQVQHVGPKKTAEGQRNEAGDVDHETFALHRYLGLLCEGQTVALDMLFAPPESRILSTPAWESVLLHRKELVWAGATAFAGYCQQQAAKYGIKGSRVAAMRKTIEFLDRLVARTGAVTMMDAGEGMALFVQGIEHVSIVQIPSRKDGPPMPHLEVCGRKFAFTLKIQEYVRPTLVKILGEYGARALAAEKNEGVDWKALSHAVRVCSEAEELLAHHRITFPRPDAMLLVAIKRGHHPYKLVAEMIENGLERLRAAEATSTLPKTPPRELADRITKEHYYHAVLNYRPPVRVDVKSVRNTHEPRA